MREEALLEKWLNLTDKSAQQMLTRAAQVVFVEANSIVLEAGETQEIVPLLISGVVRGFLLDADGRDTTDCFVYKPGEVVMGCNSLGKPSQISMETMSECTMMTVPLDIVLSLMDSCPELLHIYNRYLAEALERHWEEKMLMNRCSAMERYQWFLKHYPGLIQTVSNKHIASFLGMTPVTLSRLRRKLRDEKLAGIREE